MPAPCPFAIWIEPMPNGSMITFENYRGCKSAPHRKQRVNTLSKRLSVGGWVCRWCGNPIAIWRRVDAYYCKESCRKKAARMRKRRSSALISR